MAQDREAIELEAALWHVRQQSPDFQDGEALSLWLGVRPDHAVAFAKVSRAWNASACFLDEPTGAPDVYAPANAREGHAGLSRRAAAAGLLGLLGGGLWLSRTRSERFLTPVGQSRTVRLTDRTEVRLNTGTEILVDFERSTRKVRLVQGEAMFQVAQDLARPFAVAFGKVRTTATQATFDVRSRNELADVIVTDGFVRIEFPRGAGKRQDVLYVKAGCRALVGPGLCKSYEMGREELARRLLWREGMLELSGQTLVEAVEEFNRYRTSRLVIADDRLAGLQLGGRFGTNESDKFLAALQTGFGVTSLRGKDGNVYLTSREG